MLVIDPIEMTRRLVVFNSSPLWKGKFATDQIVVSKSCGGGRGRGDFGDHPENSLVMEHGLAEQILLNPHHDHTRTLIEAAPGPH